MLLLPPVMPACSKLKLITKSLQTMKHQALINETISQLTHRFTPKVVDVKKAIDQLIDKDYITRKDGERDTYEYVA